MHPITPTLAAVVAAVMAMPALAQATDQATRDLAATCANCHGTAGRAIGAMPVLAGQPKQDIVQKMQEFRDGKRPATIMDQLAKGYTPEQIDRIATWFAAQKAK